MSADYPKAIPGDVVDVIHGTQVADPFRWMENIDSEETRAWVEAQQAFTAAFLDGLPEREAIRARLTEAFDYDKHGLPELIEGRLFYSRKTGLQNQSIHYWREDREGAGETVLLDPNTLSEDGTVSVAGWSVSDDGKRVAYGLSESGSDWTTWHVMDVDTGRVLEDEIRWVKFSWASWAPDGSGFYYSRYAEPAEGEALKDTNLNQKAYFHVVGTPQSEDRLVYERPDHPKWGFGVGVTEDERYQIISVWEGAGSKNGFFYRDLGKSEDGKVVELFNEFDARYSLVANEGSTFYFVTDLDAPKKRLIAVDVENPDPAHWKTVLPEAEGTLQSVSFLSGHFIAQYMVDAHDVVVIHDREGQKVRELPLPNLASAGGFGGYQDDTETFYMTTGVHRPRGDLPLSRLEWREHAVLEAGFPGGSLRLRDPAGALPQQGWNGDPHVHHPTKGCADGRFRPNDLVWVRRVQYLTNAGVLRFHRHLAGAGRRLRGGESAWRWRVWRGLAQGRHAREKAKRLR